MSDWQWNVRAPSVPIVMDGEQPLPPESLEFLTSDEPLRSSLQEGGTDG